MRPLLRPAAPQQLDRLPAHDAIMQAHGPFCHLCERRLNAGGRIWQSEKNHFVQDDRTSADDWTQLLLLCHDCVDAHARASDGGELVFEFLLPHHAVTFNLHPNSPIRYHLDRVELVLVDENSNPVGPPAPMQAVIVSGSTPAAQKTIEHFALNTRYYDPLRKRLTVPAADWQRIDFDLRVQTRTEAWQRAESMALELGRLSLDRKAADLIRYAADVSGHWSVWLTVFSAAFRDLGLTADVFTPGVANGASAPVNHHHAGTHSAYLLPPDGTSATLTL